MNVYGGLAGPTGPKVPRTARAFNHSEVPTSHAGLTTTQAIAITINPAPATTTTTTSTTSTTTTTATPAAPTAPITKTAITVTG